MTAENVDMLWVSFKSKSFTSLYLQLFWYLGKEKKGKKVWKFKWLDFDSWDWLAYVSYDLVGLAFFYSPLFRLLIVYSQILWLYLKAVSERANCISRAGTGIYHTGIKMEISCFPLSLPPLPDVSASSTAFPFRL